MLPRSCINSRRQSIHGPAISPHPGINRRPIWAKLRNCQDKYEFIPVERLRSQENKESLRDTVDIRIYHVHVLFNS